MFHIAPIYNWLRHVGSSMLAQYVTKIDDKNKFNNNNNKSHITSINKNQPSYIPFSHETWMFEMKHYVSQW